MSKQANNNQTDKQEYQLIALDLIDDPVVPMRKDITNESVEELVASIRQVGILEPIILRAVNGRYEVIAGHRRTYAARLADLVEVPSILRSATDDEAEMWKIHENLHRKDITPSEESNHYSFLISKHGMTPSRIASMISKSPAYVTDRLAILRYPKFLKDAMDKGEISFSVAREFIKFDDEQQMSTAVYYAVANGMTHETALKWVQDYKRDKMAPQQTEIPSADDSLGEIPVAKMVPCIFCGSSIKLFEAIVVYIHRQCNAEAIRLQTEAPAGIQPQ